MSILVPMDIASCRFSRVPHFLFISTMLRQYRIRRSTTVHLSAVSDRNHSTWRVKNYTIPRWGSWISDSVYRDLVFHRKVVDSGTNQDGMAGCLEHANRPKNDLWLIATTNTHFIDFALLRETFARCTLYRGFVPTCQQRYCTDETTYHENTIGLILISILVCRWPPLEAQYLDG